MYAYYTVNPKKMSILKVDLTEDLLSPTAIPFPSKNKVKVVDCKDQSAHIVDVFEDDGRLYFGWGDEIVRFDNFNYYEPEVLIAKLLNDNVEITPDQLLATLIKCNNRIGVFYPLHKTTGKIFKRKTGETQNVCCVLSERYFEKSAWEYKITLEPLTDKNFKRENILFKDFYNKIINGEIDLVILKDENIDLAVLR